MSWSGSYKAVLPYLIAVETPDGSGSGFFFAYNFDKTLAAFATAAHVVEHSYTWKLPIKLRQYGTGKEIFLRDHERLVLLDTRHDSAAILISADLFDLPDVTLPMMAHDKYHPIGLEVGWVGYPGIASPHLCFFSGRISAFVNSNDSYLIDGVAINGVSGGPVFAYATDKPPVILGTVSAYLPNRVRGDALPGLVSAQDVTTFHEVIATMTTLDEGRRRQKEAEQQAAQEKLAASEQPGDRQADAPPGQSVSPEGPASS